MSQSTTCSSTDNLPIAAAPAAAQPSAKRKKITTSIPRKAKKPLLPQDLTQDDEVKPEDIDTSSDGDDHEDANSLDNSVLLESIAKAERAAERANARKALKRQQQAADVRQRQAAEFEFRKHQQAAAALRDPPPPPMFTHAPAPMISPMFTQSLAPMVTPTFAQAPAPITPAYPVFAQAPAPTTPSMLALAPAPSAPAQPDFSNFSDALTNAINMAVRPLQANLQAAVSNMRKDTLAVASKTNASLISNYRNKSEFMKLEGALDIARDGGEDENSTLMVYLRLLQDNLIVLDETDGDWGKADASLKEAYSELLPQHASSLSRLLKLPGRPRPRQRTSNSWQQQSYQAGRFQSRGAFQPSQYQGHDQSNQWQGQWQQPLQGPFQAQQAAPTPQGPQLPHDQQGTQFALITHPGKSAPCKFCSMNGGNQPERCFQLNPGVTRQ